MNLLRHSETKVQITALGALKNLSFGRTMNENKQLIGSDHGLTEIMALLKKSRASEVRELLTGLLWNLSSCEDLKMRMIQSCLHDLVEIVMVPHTKWTTEVASLPTARPQPIYWNNELKNTTGKGVSLLIFVMACLVIVHFVNFIIRLVTDNACIHLKRFD